MISPAFEEIVLGVSRLRTLDWDGDTLVDWASGESRVELNGSVQRMRGTFNFRFDAAISSKSGRFVIIYERLGTKAIVVDRGTVIRELNRSYHYADRYEYPIAFINLPDGREAIVHCPRGYRQLDIEVAETGECLTNGCVRNPSDIFHSRLMASPNTKYLVSAGWVWQPTDITCLWNVREVLEEPILLDSADACVAMETQSASFVDDERLIVSTGEVSDDTDEYDIREIRCHDRRESKRLVTTSPAGKVLPFGNDWLLSLYEHPKLLQATDGAIIKEWPHLRSGNESSCFADETRRYPFTKHSSKLMFAIADDKNVTVVRLKKD